MEEQPASVSLNFQVEPTAFFSVGDAVVLLFVGRKPVIVYATGEFRHLENKVEEVNPNV